MKIAITVRELGAILAGLITLRRHLEGKLLDTGDYEAVRDLLSDLGNFEALSLAEIDDLFERLNA